MVREKSGKSQGISLYSNCGHPVVPCLQIRDSYTEIWHPKYAREEEFFSLDDSGVSCVSE